MIYKWDDEGQGLGQGFWEAILKGGATGTAEAYKGLQLRKYLPWLPKVDPEVIRKGKIIEASIARELEIRKAAAAKRRAEAAAEEARHAAEVSAQRRLNLFDPIVITARKAAPFAGSIAIGGAALLLVMLAAGRRG